METLELIETETELVETLTEPNEIDFDIIKPENLVYTKPALMNDTPMHYCPGCSHGVIHKLVAEVIGEMGMEDKTVAVSPVGCAVFAYNYIDVDEMILRKGAIAAHSGEKVLIPINMRDGSVLAVGKGNPEWNYSAPHGAGRLMSRTAAKNNLSLDEYKEMMKGVYSTSINENTLDEAPMAYKRLEDIIDVIKESVDIIEVMKPIYNFKASN